MKVLSRVASPAGFALVLLLFFLLPFVSVSCDVPGYGEAGASYKGGHLVSGTDPEVPAELRDLGNDPGSPTALSDPPEPGAQVPAILLAVLVAAGVLTVLVPRFKTRLLTGAALAAGALVVTIVTMVVAQSNLESALLDWAREAGGAANQDRLESGVGEVIHTEIGFWLMVVLLTLLAAVTTILGLFGDRLRAAAADRASDGGSGGLSGLSFGTSDHDDGNHRSSDRRP